MGDLEGAFEKDAPNIKYKGFAKPNEDWLIKKRASITAQSSKGLVA
jgi:hypothetical protein